LPGQQDLPCGHGVIEIVARQWAVGHDLCACIHYAQKGRCANAFDLPTIQRNRIAGP
jgi:hypothetical protein